MNKYIEQIGRRKTSTARVRITPSTKPTFIVNDKNVEDYFQTKDLLNIVNSAFNKTQIPNKHTITIKVSGSGIHSQAEAIRHGITRCLVKEDENLRSELKKLGFLKRDPRSKERKKFGLKKARKRPTWSKR